MNASLATTNSNNNTYQIAVARDAQDLHLNSFGSTAKDIAFDFAVSLSFGTELFTNPASTAVEIVGGSITDALENAVTAPSAEPTNHQDQAAAIDKASASSPGQMEAASMPQVVTTDPLDLSSATLPSISEKAALVNEHFNTATGGGNTISESGSLANLAA